MSIQQKGCFDFHGVFTAGCPVCLRWRDDPRYASLRDETVAAPVKRTRARRDTITGSSPRGTAGIVVNVRRRSCRTVKCPWLWSVLVDGVVKDSGECTTEQEASAEAQQSAAELRELLGLSIVRGEYEWVTSAKLAAEALDLAAKLPRGLAGIAGIPRSGMIPAAIVASHLHLPLFELAAGRLNLLGHGTRGVLPGEGPIAVIDDTVYSGRAMARARSAMQALKREAMFATIYCRPETVKSVDFHARLLPSPHLLEWNLLNCAVLAGNSIDPVFGRGVALDLDGVIVHDAQSGGPVLSPYLVPRTVAAPLIVTGRSEAARTETEGLLRAIGAKWSRLEMLPAVVPLTTETAAEHKARLYGESGCGFFVESCPIQAELIHRTSGKPVICPVAGKVWH